MQTEINDSNFNGVENRGSLILALVSFHCCLVSLELPQAKRKERQIMILESTGTGNYNFSDDNIKVFNLFIQL